MGFLNSLFLKETPVSIAIYNRDRSFSDGIVTESYPSEADQTLQGYFWQGSQAERIVKERIRADIDGVIVLDYDDLSITINDGAKATINGVDYNIITADNVLYSNVMLVCPVKKYS